MATAAAAVGVHPLSVQASSLQAIHGVNVGDCKKGTVMFACRRRSISGATFSLNQRRQHRVAAAPRSWVVSAVATDNTVETVTSVSSTASQSSTQKVQYHYVIANAKFMLDEEEHFQELMRERLRHFGELKREQDFWLVIEPKFLSNFPEIERRLGRPAVALVSTDAKWITFMKLRLDRVLKGVFEADTLTEALAGGNASTELKFDKPEKWTAPYAKYEGDWWTPFLPPQ